MKIIFNNGSEINYQRAEDIVFTHEYAEGYNRETMTATLPAGEVPLGQLNTLLSDEDNLSSLRLLADDGTQNIYNNFVIKLRCGTERRLVDEDEQLYSEVVVFKLGKLTYIEKKLKELGVL